MAKWEYLTVGYTNFDRHFDLSKLREEWLRTEDNAEKKFTYAVYCSLEFEKWLQHELNLYGAQGWELINPEHITNRVPTNHSKTVCDFDYDNMVLLFRREKRTKRSRRSRRQ